MTVAVGAATAAAAWLIAVSFAGNSSLDAPLPMPRETATLMSPRSRLADLSGLAGILPESANPAESTAEPREKARIRISDLIAESFAFYADAISVAAPPSGTLPPAESAGRAPASALPQRAAAAPPAAPAAPAASSPFKFFQARLTPRQADNSVLPPGRDGRTAIYDIEAHTVYLPNGLRLEAHSGLGPRLDDPRYASERSRGPTPPNVYDLALRDGLFHGVRAIRLNPVDDRKMFGRDGILAHTYMLGPTGQSFGCVSFKNYAEFLKAFLRGEIDRLVVVPHLDTKSVGDQRARRDDGNRYALR